MFDQLDTNQNGFLDKSEMDNLISMAMKEQGMSEPGEAEKQEFIRLIDENHDGKISKQEFINFIKQMNGMWFL